MELGKMERIDLLSFYHAVHLLHRYIREAERAEDDELSRFRLSEPAKNLLVDKNNLSVRMEAFRLRTMPNVVTAITTFSKPVDDPMATRMLERAAAIVHALQQDLPQVQAVSLRTDSKEIRDALKEQCEQITPEAIQDANGADICYGVEDWDGCVFHLVRITEHGLRRLARHFSIPYVEKNILELQTWGKVIEQLSAIEVNLSQKTVIEKEYKATLLDALSHLRAIKCACRDVVLHSRNATLDAVQTQGLWMRTTALLKNISSIIHTV